MHWLVNVRLPHPFLTNSDENVWCIQLTENQIINSVVPMSLESEISGEDWMGDFLSPMAVDLQINGGLGIAFPELTFKDIPTLYSLLDLLWNDGVEAIAPTIVTSSVASLRQALLVLREVRQEKAKHRCRLLGAHLEGPFLSKDFLGAHNQECLALPSLEALDERISGFENEISLVTLAPELPNSMVVINRLKELGIVVSLGHSSADSEIAKIAFDEGIAMLTHTFNAMAPLHHRSPGPVGAALSHGNIALGVIADGVHLHPEIIVLLQRLASKKLVLVSDALSPYGLPDGQYSWDKRVIFAKGGACRLENGTLAGVTLPLLEGCKRLAKWSGNFGASIWSATVSPRQVIKGKSLKIEEYLIGSSLDQLLRWKTNPEKNELFWRSAV